MSSKLMDKKFAYWEHQLLDLGRRNKMINYRETKRTTIKLVEPAFDTLYKKIAINDETLTFQRPVDRETDVRVFSILSLLETLSCPLPVTIGDIKTEGSIIERQQTLKNLRSKSRLAMEEQGTNILYLSFGFLEWKEGKGASAQYVKSPLILVPASLTLDSLSSPYKLKKYEDDIVLNPTLEHYLKTEYGVDLPPFDADKDTVSSYLKALEETADKHGWRILKEVSLGLLSFLKISMYNDLQRNAERIKKHPVIRAMAGDVSAVNQIPSNLQSFDLDSVSTQDCYQVMNADSSQQEAILYAKNNVSFVMQGPPGTGKSQTITNIIAEALAQDKKVLFVSEKMAALQVVYRRLQQANLGDFCLPLHSYKANKKEIVQQIGANLKLKHTKVKDVALSNLQELLDIRKDLNGYAKQLHKALPKLNISCYEVFSKLAEVQDTTSVAFTFDDPLQVDYVQLQTLLNALGEYSLALEGLQYEVNDNAWQGFSQVRTGYEYVEELRSKLDNVCDAVNYAKKQLTDITKVDIASKISYSDVQPLCKLLVDICNLPQIPSNWIDKLNVVKSISEANQAKVRYQQLFAIKSNVKKVFNDTVYQFDYNGWQESLLETANVVAKLPILRKRTPNFYVKEAKALYTDFATLKDALSNAVDSVESINYKLGTNFGVNANDKQVIGLIVQALSSNLVLNQQWFNLDLTRVKRIVEQAKTVVANLDSERAVLEQDWEKEVFSLDYAPILARYKTDYNNFFKIFKKQYYADKKQIQVLSKRMVKRVSDTLALDMLTMLKSYRDNLDWMQTNSVKLSEMLGDYYNGADTNWDLVLEAINVCNAIKKLPISVSEKLRYLTTVRHEEDTAKLEALFDSLSTSMAKVKASVESLGLQVDSNLFTLNVPSTLDSVDTCMEQLSTLLSKKDELTPYLVQQDEQIEAIFGAIRQLNDYDKKRKNVALLEESYQKQFGSLFVGEDTNWDNIISLLGAVDELKKHPHFGYFSEVVKLTPEEKYVLGRVVKQMQRQLNDTSDEFAWIKRQLENYPWQDLSLLALSNKLDDCQQNVDNLDKWVAYQESKRKCSALGLADFVANFEKTNVYEDVKNAFLKTFYNTWLEEAYSSLDSVRRFRRASQDEKIKKFVELDELQLLIAQMRIREKLIKTLPSGNLMLRAMDEVVILNKELGKKRNVMPLRKLFKMIPNLLMKLKPCLMMSPLSVSYFLETDAYHFDLVIFDEASQIFPEDAIGAIFRGSQVIIVGDSKQLPPTNFFAATTGQDTYDFNSDEDIDQVVSDSILEETAAVLPNCTLLWHYRSKQESLIAFSNREIYQNNLITFPNNQGNTPDMGVEYVYVEDGVYDRGGKANNLREVEECVRLVFEHVEKHPNRSLGVIAFSESQQATIENAIIDYRERHPEHEWFFDESKDEPFFVKNLENVQGDERDTIIFSICYGKDKNGAMYMNFGPVGHAGGERRLNVAITRAKCNVKLVGSILPNDIDTNRAKSEGARLLRSYIDYAIRGTSALRPVGDEQSVYEQDDFCTVIANFLQENGYNLQRQVGCSDYKIDIAVIDPANPHQFVAGIECDGLSYSQAKTARDRDHLRASVLKNMGWNMYRVWSTEWVRNPNAEGQALLDFLQSVCVSSGNDGVDGNQMQITTDDLVEDVVAQNQTGSYNPYGFGYYQEGTAIRKKLSKNKDLCEQVAEDILQIVGVEQPLHIDLLYKRLAPIFTVGKVTETVKKVINRALIRNLRKKVSVDKQGFIRLLPLTEVSVRIPNEGDAPRSFEHIHAQEIALAMVQIVKNTFGITADALTKECARVFGYERPGAKIKEKCDEAIKWLQANGKVAIVEGKIQLTGDHR